MDIADLLDRVLPLNRKERYYTGTVLPAIIASDGMKHLGRLGRILGCADLVVRADRADATVLFFTEYGIAESAIGEWRDRLPGLASNETPDVVLLMTEPVPTLIALEAKVFDRPSKPELLKQLAAQQAVLEHVRQHLTVVFGTAVRVVHAALLPGVLARAVGDLGVPTVTWEEVRKTWADVAPPYWLAMIDEALRRYPALVSKWGGNQDTYRSGADLVAALAAGTLNYPWMGRRGGLRGPALRSDVITGTWRTFTYQCRTDPLSHNPNWFSVSDFARLIADHNESDT